MTIENVLLTIGIALLGLIYSEIRDLRQSFEKVGERVTAVETWAQARGFMPRGG